MLPQVTLPLDRLPVAGVTKGPAAIMRGLHAHAMQSSPDVAVPPTPAPGPTLSKLSSVKAIELVTKRGDLTPAGLEKASKQLKSSELFIMAAAAKDREHRLELAKKKDSKPGSLLVSALSRVLRGLSSLATHAYASTCDFIYIEGRPGHTFCPSRVEPAS